MSIRTTNNSTKTLDALTEHKFELSDLLLLTLFLGSLIFVLALALQLYTAYRQEGKITRKAFHMVLVTRIITVIISFYWTWFYWTEKIDIMLGPILLPAMFIELIANPTMLKLFGYQLTWKKLQP